MQKAVERPGWAAAGKADLSQRSRRVPPHCMQGRHQLTVSSGGGQGVQLVRCVFADPEQARLC